MNFEYAARNLAKDLSDLTISCLQPESVRTLHLHEDCLKELLAGRLETRRPHPRDFLASYLRKLNLTVESSFLLSIQQGDEFEIWSPDFRFIGCSGAFLRVSSYTISRLLESNWEDLFDRPAENVGAVVTAVGRLLNGEKTVTGVTGWHTVRERQAKKVEVNVEIKALSLGHSERTGEPAAIVALLGFRDRTPWKFGLA
jgi:PAS domain-containing protein